MSVFFFRCVFFSIPLSDPWITNASQTAKDVDGDQDTLAEMFERMEAFFRRLEIYTEVAPNQGMVETITAIMVEVLNIFGVATKELKQGRMSKYCCYKLVLADRAILRKICEEIDGKDGYFGCAEEARQFDTRGGSNGCCSTLEGHEYDR